MVKAIEMGSLFLLLVLKDEVKGSATLVLKPLRMIVIKSLTLLRLRK